MKQIFFVLGALLLSAVSRGQAPTPTGGASQTSTTVEKQAAANPQQNPAPAGDQAAGAPATPVPINSEPHHRLVLRNDYTRVYSVMVPPLDATLLHEHDSPYLYVTLGPADLVNAVVGQPEVHLVLQDGDTRYSPGHFAHLVRTDSGMAFHNITMELVHPQGTARNLCKGVMPGPIGECPREAAAGKKSSAEAGDDVVPYFETDEVRVELVKVGSGTDYSEEAPREHALLVALTGANLDANLGGEHIQFLHAGDILWMPAGMRRRVLDFLGTHSNFLLILFKDSAAQPAAE